MDKNHLDIEKTTLKKNIADTEDILDGSTVIIKGSYPNTSDKD